MNTPSISGISMNTSVSTIPRELPPVITLRYRSAIVFVPLPASHKDAQEVAMRSFPAALGDVDPQWLTFSIAVRYKSTGQRDEVVIAPKSWGYVTAKLQPYRCIDIHVVPKSAPPSPMPSSSSSSSSYTPLYPETPPAPPVVPLYQDESKYANAWYYNSGSGSSSSSPSRPKAPPYSRTPSGKDNDSPSYFDAPPPKYPGSPERKSHSLLEPSNYGYGFGWGNQIQSQSSQAYFEPILSPLSRNLHTLEEEDVQQTSNRRSMGWSASSVRMSSPDRGRNDRRPSPTTISTPSSRSNLGLFSSIRHRMFPIAWAENRSRNSTRRRRRPTQAVDDIPNYDRETDYDTYSSSGRSYVPSLI